MTVSEKIVKYFKIVLIFIIVSLILSKAVTSLLIANRLIRVKSLTELLPLSKVTYFRWEYLYRLGLAFSDLSFNTKAPLALLSFFDVLPLLSIILLLEVNRITVNSKGLFFTLINLLILYALKYLALFTMVILAISLNYNFNFILGLNYLGLMLLIISILQILTLTYLTYKSFKSLKIVKVE